MKAPKTRESVTNQHKPRKSSHLTREYTRMAIDRFRQSVKTTAPQPKGEASTTEKTQNELEQRVEQGTHKAVRELLIKPKTRRSQTAHVKQGASELPGGSTPDLGSVSGTRDYTLRKNMGGPRRFQVVGRYPGGAPLARGGFSGPADAGRALQMQRFGKTFTINRSAVEAQRKRHQATATHSASHSHTHEKAMARNHRGTASSTSKRPTSARPAAAKQHRRGKARPAPKTAHSAAHGLKVKNPVEAVKQGRMAAQRSAQATRKAAHILVRTAKAIARVSAAAVKGIATLALSGGGAALLVCILFAAVATLVASPFGILFAGEESGPEVKPLAQIIGETQGQLDAAIEQIRLDYADAHEIHVIFNESESNTALNHWPDVLAVFAVKTTLADDDAADVVVLDADKQARLQTVFWDMTPIEIQVIEEIRTKLVLNDDDEWVEEENTHVTVNIIVSTLNHRQGAEHYGFTTDQREVLRELLQPEYVEILLSMTGLPSGRTLTPEELAALRAQLAGLSLDRQALINEALTLVGRVPYFWGGKSSAIGWDERWGTDQKVTAAGSKTTGTSRAFGMDCSGYVAWCFNQIGVSPDILGYSSSRQWDCSVPTERADAQPGDLAFFCLPGTGAQHIGLIVGMDEAGQPLVVHCNAGNNNITIDGAYDVGFLYLRRFIGFTEGEE